MARFLGFARIPGKLLGLCSALLAVSMAAQQAGHPPLTKDNVVRLLKGDVAPHRVGEMVRERGIDFEVTPEVEQELRRAGATDELLATLRQLPRPVRENAEDGLKYVLIPPGTFTMGCSPSDAECEEGEKPPHQVTISRGFWLGQTPVTVAAYKRFANGTRAQMPEAPDFNRGWKNDQMPIVNVAWDEAQAYCKWAGGRLPTEAEWEYAARGGRTEALYGPLDEIAWYNNNSGGRTHEVGEKRPNSFGLYDMLGNVWDWVNDWYDEKYYQNSPAIDPQGPSSGQGRVLRGGSWIYSLRLVRVSFRIGYGSGTKVLDNGFRCVREVRNPWLFFLFP